MGANSERRRIFEPAKFPSEPTILILNGWGFCLSYLLTGILDLRLAISF